MAVFKTAHPQPARSARRRAPLRRRRVHRVHRRRRRGGASRSPSTSALVASTAAVLRDEYGVGRATGSRSSAPTRPSGSSRSGRRSASARSRSGSTAGRPGPRSATASTTATRRCSSPTRRRLARLEGEDPGVPVVEMETGFDALWRAHPDAALPDTDDRRGRPRAHPLHVGHDRAAEGRGAHARQRRRAARDDLLPRRARVHAARRRPGRRAARRASS